MAKKKLPAGWNSWIEFHDYLKKFCPEYNKTTKTIHIMTCNPLGGKSNEDELPIEKYSISIAALERLCWKEIKDMRLNYNETEVCIHELARNLNYNNDMRNKVCDFLYKIQEHI